MKYLCCDRKSSPRYKRYRDLIKIVAERMDICQIVTNSGNINMLSNVLLKPYQKKLISQEKISGLKESESEYLSIGEAVTDLRATILGKGGDKITSNINSFLLKLMGEEGKQAIQQEDRQILQASNKSAEDDEWSKVIDDTESKERINKEGQFSEKQ